MEKTQTATEAQDSSHERPWFALETGEAADEFGTSVENGLDSGLAASRLSSFGPNELTAKPKPPFWKKLLEQFSSFLVIILILAAVVSALVGEYVEAIAITAIVLLNAALGVIQERRAEEAMAASRN